MTVYIEKPAVKLREELASLRNQGGYEEQQFWFDGLVTNGTFDADTNWTKGTGWTISGGVATHSGGIFGTLVQSMATSIGSVYLITADLTYISGGSIQFFENGSGGETWNSSTSIQKVFVATANNSSIGFGAGSGNWSVDNITVFETDGTDVVHRMPKGWVPKDVFEDGLLQREGAANDYTVVYDGFDYYVKPAVAPSATTQTCVIGVRK